MLYFVQHSGLFLRETLNNVVLYATFWAWGGENAPKCCTFYNIFAVNSSWRLREQRRDRLNSRFDAGQAPSNQLRACLVGFSAPRRLDEVGSE